MLIFQDDVDHIKDRCKERWGKSFPELVQLVHEINRYLPADWRMTARGNYFRIQIINNDLPTIALPGNSYRGSGNEIFHVINTVLGGYMADIQFKRKKKLPGETPKAHKEKNPQIVIPNAYYFRPVPDGFNSPLFVRQFEKLHNKDKKNQYHRIHPLTKDGVDRERYLWVCWNVDQGTVEIKEPPNNFHGKNYWQIPLFSDAFRRKKNVHSKLTQQYKKILRQYGMHENDTQSPKTAYTPEYKFLLPGNAGTEDPLLFQQPGKMIRRFLAELNKKQATLQAKVFRVIAQKATTHCDTYLDDKHSSIYAAGGSLRIRQQNSNLFLTLKKQGPYKQPVKEDTLYRRFAEEVMITRKEQDRILKNQPANLLPLTVLEYVVPGKKELRPIFKATTGRYRLLIEISHESQIELRLDRTVYTTGKRKSAPFYEIEIESNFGKTEVLDIFCEALQTHFSLTPSRLSKYERGIFLKKSREANIDTKPYPGKVIIDTDCGVDDALALVLALRSPEIEVEAVTTVSGNVHLDKVVPNVFKVLDILELESPPPVARGAAKPLYKEPSTAASVHGKDGLGDVIQSPSQTTCVEKPAWQVICDMAKKSPGQLTLITLGPLTNLAIAIQKEPNSIRCLKEIVCMGGVFFNVGNVAPDAEFNIHTDPDAAEVVVGFCRQSMQEQIAGRRLPLTFVGLDVTHKVFLSREELAKAVEMHPENRILRFAFDITEKYMGFYKANEGLHGCYLHDPLAVAHVLNRAFLDTEQHIIRVETRGQFTNGVIFPDDRPTRNTNWRNPGDAVISIARDVNKCAFEEFFFQRLI